MKSWKKILPAIVLLGIFAVAMSSCQRGYGCPYKFQANGQASQVK
jgi:hypothetical protein